MVEEANRFARRLDSTARYVDSLLEQGQVQPDRLVRAARFDPVVEYVENLKRATANLDRGQLSRVNEVVAGFDEFTLHDEAHRTQSHPGRFLALSGSRSRKSNLFEEYLRRAHRHPAVARKQGGRRQWFEVWLRHALLLASHGFESRRFKAIVDTASPPKRHCVAAWPPRRSTVLRHRFRERLLNVIVPHGPTPVLLLNRPTPGGGLPALSG